MEKFIAMFDELEALVAQFQTDIGVFGTPEGVEKLKYADFRDLRKTLQQVKVKAQEIRKMSSAVEKEALKKK